MSTLERYEQLRLKLNYTNRLRRQSKELLRCLLNAQSDGSYEYYRAARLIDLVTLRNARRYHLALRFSLEWELFGATTHAKVYPHDPIADLWLHEARARLNDHIASHPLIKEGRVKV